ncbi:DUF3489 domain-containing protein [Laribacter hongkongensis]|jgi:hypothetical protein|uniref:DUF3489 domain containing protein n=1 Tax=Laribacter hongkongensis TaxID=168471 RepID=A0A248LNG2_9NEIS|nr:DUF3489 domain-containing protein [Laribacter hongkongensis]ASJ25703.1 DUF3489 domain containing protein [Laribacter hongkongensis]MCG9087507.1 DUF3489 domain-containing protein [Laribacter hongkongensis]MCG9109915.1 DUF3489 domain-containing protein [Laribacter hongkongensis]MCG9120450.1 DUF3489 domain-containing protein [Laribacter hongkongensis]
MTIALNPNQQAILEHAVQHSGGKIIWFPEHIKGGARAKVLEGLFKRALITPYGDEWIVAAEGYDALGLPRPVALPPTITLDDPELEADVASAEASWQQHDKDKLVRTRADSKQALVIGLLQRPEGATIAQIMQATGWQQHTVRGTLAGTLKKRLGLTITSTKEAGGQRVYRIESATSVTETA